MKPVPLAVSVNDYARDQNGASLIEYSLLTGLVSIAIVTAIAAISGNLAITWSILSSIVAQAAGG
ncbi:MAG: hypothetical protein A3E78_06385 [Alphaproteobacteria bacterium RIFCSPHIGHO2_12_FULL_63_12]|nr:MAG: hypothetical protein A3E78_06385 [Alphaproteobacteria bacterium RIFCSPHIGHO2_12_FULL_63_12]